MLTAVQQNGGVVNANVERVVREQIHRRFGLALSEAEVQHWLQAACASGTMVGGGGPAAASGGGAGLDAEDQVGLLMSLLHDHGLPGSGSPEPPGLDAHICQGLQAVMAMPHNRALARRVHSESRARAAAGEVGHEQTLAAARVQVDLILYFTIE